MLHSTEGWVENPAYGCAELAADGSGFTVADGDPDGGAAGEPTGETELAGVFFWLGFGVALGDSVVRAGEGDGDGTAGAVDVEVAVCPVPGELLSVVAGTGLTNT
jgi:hypothetical protein